MKIGYIVQQFYPLAYGSGVHAYELTKELTKFGHEIHIITKGEPGQQVKEIFHGIHIHRILRTLQLPYYFPFNPILLWELGKKITKNLDLDMLIGHGFESSLFVSMRKKIPYIYKAAGTIGLQQERQLMTWRDGIGRLYFPVLGALEKAAIRYANRTIAISEAIKSELITGYGIHEKRIIRIYNGVNTQRFHSELDFTSLKNRLELENKKVILFVGRLTQIKGPHLLVQAIKAIIQNYSEVAFLFLGDGPLKSYLKAFSQQLKVDKYVKFLGFVPNSEVPKYFAMADLCTIPSFYEPFGLVALESLAAETPILSSINGGLAEIQRYLKGFPKLAPLNAATLTRKVLDLLSNENKLKRLGKEGRKIVKEQFTWERTAKATIKLLEKIKKVDRKI